MNCGYSIPGEEGKFIWTGQRAGGEATEWTSSGIAHKGKQDPGKMFMKDTEKPKSMKPGPLAHHSVMNPKEE